jgi:hypothetical protein
MVRRALSAASCTIHTRMPIEGHTCASCFESGTGVGHLLALRRAVVSHREAPSVASPEEYDEIGYAGLPVGLRKRLVRNMIASIPRPPRTGRRFDASGMCVAARCPWPRGGSEFFAGGMEGTWSPETPAPHEHETSIVDGEVRR